MSHQPRIAFVTLGCKLNFSESSTFARQFATAGYKIVRPVDHSDWYVVNTCSVTEHADKKCRNIIRKLHKISPDARIAVVGCYAQLKPDEILAIEGVDIVLGAARKGDLFEVVTSYEAESGPVSGCMAIEQVENIFPAYSSGERTRSFLKVQDGCDYRCTYCTVPLARGTSRNLPIATLVAQAREIAATGICEIVLTGVNIGDFGRTTGESFFDLLKALNEVEGIARYRISSIEPNLLTREIIGWMAGGRTKFLPHFHIPLQSGCDRILKAMHRRYTTQMFEEKIALLREQLERPEERGTKVFFGIDVIVGFPGETEEDFEATYRLLERVKPAFLHIFPYSRRAGTPAAEREDQVQESVKTERVARLEKLSDRLHADFCRANKGREAEVLFESANKGGMMFGYTDNYIRIEREYDPAQIGRIVKVIV
ncbi:MAG: tRNA (N(6)-L-threonylcarbamoyladenosine(37)-C(2))-methylthiotransferase MtaB [Bacteroidales bacterium]|nr:tRNA (N(6)-L-threonylcarbamoyladenosine(37)-C(2))-methylthiotransferase MtaB [Bacteroidales bacterium]